MVVPCQGMFWCACVKVVFSRLFWVMLSSFICSSCLQKRLMAGEPMRRHISASPMNGVLFQYLRSELKGTDYSMICLHQWTTRNHNWTNGFLNIYWDTQYNSQEQIQNFKRRVHQAFEHVQSASDCLLGCWSVSILATEKSYCCRRG